MQTLYEIQQFYRKQILKFHAFLAYFYCFLFTYKNFQWNVLVFPNGTAVPLKKKYLTWYSAFTLTLRSKVTRDWMTEIELGPC